MVEVERHISKEELANLIREETDPRIKDRLNFIQHLYHGDEIPEAISKVGYGTTTGYNWVHAWNDEGVEGEFPISAADCRRNRSPKRKDGSSDFLLKTLHGQPPRSTNS